MKDIYKQIEYKGRAYKLVFNINVMEQIQDEYGSMAHWGELTDGSATGEASIKAIKFGICAMLNEGIDIENEENGTDIKPFTRVQVGRLLSEIGLDNITEMMTKTVIDSTQPAEKNA